MLLTSPRPSWRIALSKKKSVKRAGAAWHLKLDVL